MRNQCDGCAAGMPLDEHGIHTKLEHGRVVYHMGCEAEKYKPESNSFSVSIALDSDAFAEAPGREVAGVLRRLAHAVQVQGIAAFVEERVLRDVNGNVVGAAQFLREGAQ